MSAESDVRFDLIVAAVLRKVSVRSAEDFLSSPEYLALSDEDKDRLAIADAELEELDRQARQQARQEAAERGDHTR